jgi:ADP-heptose:LPS heptosyltransferase
MQKLILTNWQSPGDMVVLSAAVRDLHACYPGQFLTDVRTFWPELWQYNPYLTRLEEKDPDVQMLECRCPAITGSNRRSAHFIQGFIEDLNQQLKLQITLTRFGGDIHLSEAERAQPSPVKAITGLDVPYWILVAGGKYDFTIKWRHFRRWQAVVDRFRDKLLFVQVGEKHDYHPALDGVLDLRGKTTLRDLIRLVYHADGVLCPVTFAMHLAAAVEPGPGKSGRRPCVVVAGGREPPQWEAYPTHQFIHTIGLLPCCQEGGCWRSRSAPLEDGEIHDRPESLCIDLVNNLPRCMHLITPEAVAERIELCLRSQGHAARTSGLVQKALPFLSQRSQLTIHHVRKTDPLSTNHNNKPKQSYA